MPLTEIIAKINSRNQVTLPDEILRLLGVMASDTVVFVLHNDGLIELQSAGSSLESIIGSVPALPATSLDFEREIEEATAAEIERLGRRKL
ncbi:MAG: AbrB/MazE/SpoVT family DNA-binding domain-containing protein [Chloroflexota bacterium]|nr:AbrB/MazE/SpoVT family DNA-binding domain-containing protein [Chloroflexia bacterium]MDQ3226163.1 AbrB/MazE/SpoVT family DNA-binding domain-containing protein [Chloroflexota bacterium]